MRSFWIRRHSYANRFTDSKMPVLLAVSLLALLCRINPASADPPGDLTGIWQSDGYNQVLEIGEDDYTLYEITAMSAVKAQNGKVASIQDDLGEVRIVASSNTLAVLPEYTIAPITYQRIDRLPDTCTRQLDLADPVSQFEILWHTFEENYAFFQLRGVDWSSEYKKWRRKVSADTSETDLFDICATMVSGLNDNHVLIDAPGFDYSQYRRAPDLPLVRQWRSEFDKEKPGTHFMKYIRGKYGEYISTSQELLAGQLTGRLSLGANDRLAWGILPNQVGYLNIRAMGDYSDDDEPSAQFAALGSTLDRAFADMADVRGMIVDVRFNGGGWDDAALLIAGRFADKRRVAFSKKARANDAFTTPHVVYVEPGGSCRFTRPVVLLTSPMTASAAEVFVYCMVALPHITHVGLPTMGIHSDMLERHLPNGWEFYLSNEIYQDPNGDVYEKSGIPPKHKISMFTPDDFKDRQDQIIVRALSLIGSR